MKQTEKTNPTTAVTLVGFGTPQEVQGSGDTWQIAHMANDSLFIMNNDGSGIEPRNTEPGAFTTKAHNHAVISMLPPSFNPEFPHTVTDITDGRRIIHPASETDFLQKHMRSVSILNEDTQTMETFAHPYSTDIYEIDGVLYHIVIYSRQIPGNWGFVYSNLTRSLDMGRTWENFKGEIDTPTEPTWEDSFFPKGWGQVTFVKYGKGGAAPDVDRAQEFVYVLARVDERYRTDDTPAGYNMARIRRSVLLEWNTAQGNTNVRNQWEFFSFGLVRTAEDAKMAEEDRFWVSDPTKAMPFFDEGWSTAIVYNEGLGRYFKTLFISDAFQRPIIESTLSLHEAPHPWGPWVRIHEEHMQAKANDNLTWAYLFPKFISADGKKMWKSVTGALARNSHVFPRGHDGYTLQVMPVFLTTEPAHTIYVTDQEKTTHNGLEERTYNKHKDNCDTQITGLGGFEAGRYISFKLNAPAAGEYIVNFRYRTTGITGAQDASDEAMELYRRQTFPSISLYLNDVKRKQLPLGRTVQVYSEWSNMSLFLPLDAGENVVTFRMHEDDNGSDVVIHSLTFAKYTGVMPLPLD